MSAVAGVAEFKRALAKLTPKLAEKVTKKALRQAANMVAKQARANAPISASGSRYPVGVTGKKNPKYKYEVGKRGRVRRAIRVKNNKEKRLNKNGMVGVYLFISPGKSRKDQSGAYYAAWLENGYKRGSKRGARARTVGKSVPGLRFVRKAYESTKSAAANLIIQNGTAAALEAARDVKLK